MQKKQVAISEIEAELQRLWEALPGAEKLKSALFTLIAYVEDPAQLEHTQQLLRHILGRYPCRVLLLQQQAEKEEIEVTVSLELVGEGKTQITCDQIEVAFPPHKKQEIPFLVLPHLLSNVPVCMLWKGTPSPQDPLYALLKGTINRLVIDPANLEQAQFAEELWTDPHVALTDLKWASATGWRRILAKTLQSEPCLEAARHPIQFEIRVANGSHPNGAQPLSAIYLKAWLTAQLGWAFEGTITPVDNTQYGYGTLLSVDLTTQEGFHFLLTLEPSGEFVRVEASSPEWCEVPASSYLGPFEREAIFAKELFRDRPGIHYSEMLKRLPWKQAAFAT